MRRPPVPSSFVCASCGMALAALGWSEPARAQQAVEAPPLRLERALGAGRTATGERVGPTTYATRAVDQRRTGQEHHADRRRGSPARRPGAARRSHALRDPERHADDRRQRAHLPGRRGLQRSAHDLSPGRAHRAHGRARFHLRAAAGPRQRPGGRVPRRRARDLPRRALQQLCAGRRRLVGARQQHRARSQRRTRRGAQRAPRVPGPAAVRHPVLPVPARRPAAQRHADAVLRPQSQLGFEVAVPYLLEHRARIRRHLHAAVIMASAASS